MELLIEKTFFGKESALIVTLNKAKECFFSFGKIQGKLPDGKDNWLWKKVKMNDNELGDILKVLLGKKDSISFFHSFGKGNEKSTTQIWINKMPDGNCVFKVKEATRALGSGEQEVLRVLLEHSIMMTALRL